LLGAARYLAETRNFDRTIVFIFQPAEEGLGGARAMLADGLFERFPCDEIYGLHNAPDLDPLRVASFAGPSRAGADFFDIIIAGRGSHAATPHKSKDPIIVAATITQALQSIVSRNLDPFEPAVVSDTQIIAGSAYNVIPDYARLAGAIRVFSDEIRATMRERVRTICDGVAASFGVETDIDMDFTKIGRTATATLCRVTQSVIIPALVRTQIFAFIVMNRLTRD
jgi:amidohydrolase